MFGSNKGLIPSQTFLTVKLNKRHIIITKAYGSCLKYTLVAVKQV